MGLLQQFRFSLLIFWSILFAIASTQAEVTTFEPNVQSTHHLVHIKSYPIRIRTANITSSVVIKGEKIHIKTASESFLASHQPDVRSVATAFSALSTISIQLVDQHKWKILNLETQETYEIRQSRLLIEGQNLFVNQVESPNQIELIATEKTKLVKDFDVVATLELEEYLLDVVASEVPSHWPLESLKAQAVAARTYALVIQSERVDKPYEIDSTTQHQVFNYKRHLKVKDPKNVIRAVKSTRQKILQDKSSRLYKTYFHAHCGGESEDPGAVWGTPNPDFKPNYDKQSCESSPSGAWTFQISESDLVDRLSKAEPALKDSPFLQLKLVYKPLSRRLESVEVITVNRVFRFRSQDFRAAVGYTQLKSTIFSLEVEGLAFNFKGQGYGHGVGLCQTGSRWMALTGSHYREILRRYYPQAHLSELKNRSFILSKN